jgi:hypothetical protein
LSHKLCGFMSGWESLSKNLWLKSCKEFEAKVCPHFCVSHSPKSIWKLLHCNRCD